MYTYYVIMMIVKTVKTIDDQALNITIMTKKIVILQKILIILILFYLNLFFLSLILLHKFIRLNFNCKKEQQKPHSWNLIFMDLVFDTSQPPNNRKNVYTFILRKEKR